MAATASMASATLIRGADLVATPWKNGGGVTREIAAFPEGAGLDAFVWRVSIAEVAQAGPFSRFAGIDRTLALLSGEGMMLDETDNSTGDVLKTYVLTQPLDIARFAGESRIDARLVGGATRDFNLMVRRGAALGETEVLRGGTQRGLSADVVLMFCASGPVNVTLKDHEPAHSLGTNDTLRIDAPNALTCTIKGPGALLALSIRYVSR